MFVSSSSKSKARSKAGQLSKAASKYIDDEAVVADSEEEDDDAGLIEDDAETDSLPDYVLPTKKYVILLVHRPMCSQQSTGVAVSKSDRPATWMWS